MADANSTRTERLFKLATLAEENDLLVETCIDLASEMLAGCEITKEGEHTQIAVLAVLEKLHRDNAALKDQLYGLARGSKPEAPLSAVG